MTTISTHQSAFITTSGQNVATFVATSISKSLGFTDIVATLRPPRGIAPTYPRRLENTANLKPKIDLKHLPTQALAFCNPSKLEILCLR
jgi:hypothetical protein